MIEIKDDDSALNDVDDLLELAPPSYGSYGTRRSKYKTDSLDTIPQVFLFLNYWYRRNQSMACSLTHHPPYSCYFNL